MWLDVKPSRRSPNSNKFEIKGELDVLKALSHWLYRRVGRQGDTNMGGKVLNMEKGYSKINFTSCIILPKTGIEKNTGKKLYIMLRLTKRFTFM